MDITTATPTEIDTLLAEIYGRAYLLEQQALIKKSQEQSYRKGLKRLAEGNLSYSGWSEDVADRLHDERLALLIQVDEVLAEAAPFEAEFTRRGGWTRFFSVTGGHIHSSMTCPTCNKNGKATRFGWLPEWSGQSEDEALAALISESAKTILCTVCYPNAPVAWTQPREDDVCKGSGQYPNRDLPNRLGFYTGNWATCEICIERVTVLRGGKIRKHKA